MSATLKQTIANRLNALLSTGPKSPEGKARSSRNATTHGLSRAGVRPPADQLAAIAERKASWQGDYRPEGPAQEWAFDRLVAESVRLESCEGRIFAARFEYAERASESWDDDRDAAVASRAASLSHRPDVIQPILLQSKHGVLWLLERWDEVAESLRHREGWTLDTWNKALDLLGVPISARDGSGPWDLDRDDKTEAPGLDLVRRSTEALRDRLDAYLDDRDARARLDAELGLNLEDPPAIRLLERYAADARRRMSFFLNELRRLQSSRSRSGSDVASSATSPEPPRPPGPRPDRTLAARSVPRAEPESPPTDPVPPSRNEPASGRAGGLASPLRAAVPAPSPPLNRRARRAQAAQAARARRS